MRDDRPFVDRRKMKQVSSVALLVVGLWCLCEGGPIATECRAGTSVAHVCVRVEGRVRYQGHPTAVRWGGGPFAQTDVARVLFSSNRGEDWHEVASASASAGSVEWMVSEAAGRGFIRVEISGEGGTRRSPARRIRVVPTVKEFADANSYTVALMTDGTVRAWGIFDVAYLPREQAISRLPRRIDGLTDIVGIGAGGRQAFFIRADGALLAWGDPDGLDTARFQTVPTVVPDVVGATLVRCGIDATVARLGDGRVLGWGTNPYGCMADGTTVSCPDPIEIAAFQDVLDVEFGAGYGIALKSDGTVLAWGLNDRYQLGVNDVPWRNEPGLVPGVSDVVGISTRDTTVLALKRDGTVLSWGGVFNGPIGGPIEDISQLPTPVPGVSGAVSVGCAFSAGFALLPDGHVAAWGYNGNGQLGDGTYVSSSEPVEALIENVEQLFVGENTVHAVTSRGDVYGWGARDSHTVGDGGFRDRTTPRRIRVR